MTLKQAEFGRKWKIVFMLQHCFYEQLFYPLTYDLITVCSLNNNEYVEQKTEIAV